MLRKRSLGLSSSFKSQQEGSWAVSYADFLMVLLSFFIVFFSFDEKSPLHSIVVSLKQSAVGSAPGTANADIDKHDNSALQKVASVFRLSKLETSITKERIVIDLPADIYRVGSYVVPEAEIANVLKSLEPFQNEISITVMGHSDTMQFQDTKKVIKNNLTLSSMRAAYSSAYIQEVLPKVQVWIQASEESRRQTRSLSFVIEGRKVVSK